MTNSYTTYIRLFFENVSGHKGKLASLIILLLAGGGLEISQPLVLQRVIDSFQTEHSFQPYLLGLVLAFIGIGLAAQAIRVWLTNVSGLLSWSATNQLRAKLAAHVTHASLSFFEKYTPGELVERIDGDTSQLSQFFSTFVLYIAGNILLIVGAIIVLFSINSLLGLTLSIYVAAFFYVIHRVGFLAVPHWANVRQASSKLFGLVEEALSALDDLRANGGRNLIIERLFSTSRQLASSNKWAAALGSLSISAPLVLFAMGTVAMLAVCAYLLSTQAITIGTVYAVYFYTELIKSPMRDIGSEFESFQSAIASVERINALLADKQFIPDTGRLDLSPGALSISFEGVSFSYRSKENVLRDVSFEIQPGESLAIVGRTGSGKTTISRLLFRLYEPSHGTIRLSGHDIRSITQTSLRQHIGYIPQDAQFINATVRDNVTFFDGSISDDVIREALFKVGLKTWLDALPQGLDSRLFAKNHSMSVGQTQLFALARMLIKKPGIIILDEATAHIDALSEKALIEALSTVIQECTLVIVAHRLPMVQLADKVIVIESGAICEQGRTNQLASNPDSKFYQLMSTSAENVSSSHSAVSEKPPRKAS